MTIVEDAENLTEDEKNVDTVNKDSSEPTINIEESSALVALRVEADEEVNLEMEELKKIYQIT